MPWVSTETMKYLLGSPARAVRVQTLCPGVTCRHALRGEICSKNVAKTKSRGQWHYADALQCFHAVCSRFTVLRPMAEPARSHTDRVQRCALLDRDCPD